MERLLAPELLIFVLLVFCMGARIIKGRLNGRSFSLSVDADADADEDE